MATWFEEYLDAWKAEDVDKVMAWFTDDVVFEDTTAGHKATGAVQMTKFVRGSFKAVPGASFEFVKGWTSATTTTASGSCNRWASGASRWELAATPRSVPTATTGTARSTRSANDPRP